MIQGTTGMESKRKKKQRELFDLRIEEVSICGTPANMRPFAFVKSQEAPDDTIEAVSPKQAVRQALKLVDESFREAGHEPTQEERVTALGQALERLVADEVLDSDALQALTAEAVRAVDSEPDEDEDGDDEVVEVDLAALAEQVVAEVMPDSEADGDD